MTDSLAQAGEMREQWLAFDCVAEVLVWDEPGWVRWFPGRTHGEHSFFGQPGKQHPDGSHVLFNRGRRGLALQGLDICGNRNGFNVFEVLITGSLGPGDLVADLNEKSSWHCADQAEWELDSLCSGWPTNTDLSECVWLFAEESANGLRFN